MLSGWESNSWRQLLEGVSRIHMKYIFNIIQLIIITIDLQSSEILNCVSIPCTFS